MATYVYVISKPGNDLDNEEASFGAHTLEAAQLRADAHARAIRARLVFLGTKSDGRFTPAVAYEALPWWAQAWVDEQKERDAKVAARRRRVA